jgi:hypothetical protein
MNDDVKKLAGQFYWSNFYELNQLSGKYQFEFGNLSDAAVKWLEEKGIEVKNKGDERGYYLTYKSANYPFKPLDDEGLPWNQEVKVGNGSKGVVVTGLFEWKFKNKKGVSPSAKKVVITQLKEYKPEGESVDEGEEAL